MNTLTDAQLEEEVAVSHDTVLAKFGVDSRFYRPPYGLINAKGREVLGRRNMETVMWDIDVQDWLYLENDPNKMQLAAFKQQLDAGGTLVVAHYLYSTTVDQLEEMITYAKGKGRRFVQLDECIGGSSPPTGMRRLFAVLMQQLPLPPLQPIRCLSPSLPPAFPALPALPPPLPSLPPALPGSPPPLACSSLSHTQIRITILMQPRPRRLLRRPRRLLRQLRGLRRHRGLCHQP